MMILTSKIKWQPFSKKHKRYIKAALNNRICVAEGAIRSGKTIDHCIIAAMYLEQSPDRIHLASGSTIPNAKLNIGDCNGFGLEHLFRGRCRWGKYKDNDALFIRTQTGNKIVIFAGGGKADSYKRILGNSYGLWIATEINEHYDSEDSRTSFIKVASGRQTAALWPFTLWDLNPCHPEHTIYRWYIDYYKETMPDKYLYQQFVMADNLSISPGRVEEIISQYTKDSVWYRRDILGERVAAEGLIYRQFADNKDQYIKKLDKENLNDVMFLSIGIDFGGSKSLTAFVATAIHTAFNRVTVVSDYKIKAPKGEIDAERVCKELLNFINRIKKEYPWLFIKYIWADNEAQYLINSIRGSIRSSGMRIEVRDSKKKRIKDRIVAANTLLNTNRLFIGKDCILVQGGLASAVWDSKRPDERLDNFSTDIDILDAFEYSWEPFISRLCPDIR
ncbi:MAG: PBSX family phage terminase large subunit [Ruminococcaceae bacterium]|nr:PBSX family phage terminase large subunit [Oscillospiraceae bacterium]